MKTVRKYDILLITLLLCGIINGQNLVSHDFNDSTLGPFEVCTTQNPNYTNVTNNRLKTWWTSAGYNGTRMDKGAEACADQWFTYKEGWYGMNIEIGGDYPKDTKAGIAQIFGFVPGFWSWEAMLQIDDGDLTVVHRPNKGTSQNTEEVVYANFPYEQKIPVVMHFILSQQNKGVFEVWVNGALEYQKTNINFGFGDFNSNDIKIGNANGEYGSDAAGSLTVLKIGQYNFTDSEYDTNETRTVYYDDVTWYSGPNGYNIVNPDDNAVISCDSQSAFSTIQAENFCEQSGIQTDAANTKVGWINDGDWIMFEDVDFDSGAESITIAASSGNSGGTIEIRQGSASGSLLGSVTVNNTGSWNNFETYTTDIPNVSGTQNIYLVFKGVGSGYLLDVDYFRFTESTTTGAFIPDPNKTYYIDAPHHNLRLAATGESEEAYTTSTTTTGADVEWKFVDRENGYWHIQRAAGGSKPRLRTDQNEDADMQPTSSRGTWTYFDFTEGFIENTYFLTLPAVTTEFKRLQIDRDGAVKMVGDDRNGTWESFRITEASAPATFYRIEAEDYDAMSGIQTEGSIESGDNVGWINNGDWLRFDNIDLTGAQSVDLRVASNFTGGTIQIRTGSTTGTLIGSTSVSYTGGHQEWVTVSTSISNVSGVQDLYLVFTGGSGYLFNINWLEFSANSLNAKNIAPTNKALVYPTFIEDVVNIKLTASQESAVIDIINISGQVVASKNIINNETNTMNLESIPSGLYIMKITDLEGITTQKIVKK